MLCGWNALSIRAIFWEELVHRRGEGVSWLGELNAVVCICLDAKLTPSFFVIPLIYLIVISDVHLTRQCAIGITIESECIPTRAVHAHCHSRWESTTLHLSHADCRRSTWSYLIIRSRAVARRTRSTIGVGLLHFAFIDGRRAHGRPDH